MTILSRFDAWRSTGVPPAIAGILAVLRLLRRVSRTGALRGALSIAVASGLLPAARRRSTVTLLVSHRFPTVGMADLIVVLEGGQAGESGSHRDLVARGGTYDEPFELQSRGYR
jgi:ABC-type transport system involved in Fe-S cluster assembly fused permease/ATPase subunit